MRNSVFKAPSGALVSAQLLPLWREGVCVAQACPPPPLAASPAWLPAQPAAHPDLPPRPGVSSLAGGSARLSPSLRCHHGDHLPLPLPARALPVQGDLCAGRTCAGVLSQAAPFVQIAQSPSSRQKRWALSVPANLRTRQETRRTERGREGQPMGHLLAAQFPGASP